MYAVANIRGGGEYGPRWHQAALQGQPPQGLRGLRRGRARTWSHARSPRTQHLGIQGGSNGGLLIGNMLTQYPELFGAVVVQVPLLDMKRYSHLLAGASWMAEYGDPDTGRLGRSSRRSRRTTCSTRRSTYPPVLFTTSTKDDRVHPGHARKMMAKMLEAGQGRALLREHRGRPRRRGEQRAGRAHERAGLHVPVDS